MNSDKPIIPGKQLHIAKQLGYSVAGQFGYVLTQMAVLAALSQMRGAEDVGQFGLALAMTTPLFMFVNMGGKTSQSSDIGQKYSFAEYGALVAMLATVGLVATVVLGAIYVSSTSTLIIMIVVGLTKFAESFSNLSYGAYQQAGRTDLVAASLLMRGLLTLPLFVAFLAAGAPTGVAFTAQLVCWTLLVVLRDYPAASRMAAGALVWPRASWSRLWVMARETFPIGASYFVNSLLTSLPRFVVERSLGLSSLGLLTVVGYFQQAGTLMAGAAGQALVNRFALIRHADDRVTMRRVVLILTAIATVLSIAGVAAVVLVGAFVLSTLFGPEFRSAQSLLVLVALAVCTKLYGIIPQSVMHADRRYKTFLAYEIVSVLALGGALIWLVPRFGLIGAGYAILMIAVFRFAILVASTLRGGPSRPGAGRGIDEAVEDIAS